MDRFCFIAIMLFAIQRNIDSERDTLSRADLLEFEFSDAMYKHNMYDVSFGTYNKYFNNKQFLERIWPLRV